MSALENHVHEKFCQMYFQNIGTKGYAAKVWAEISGSKNKNSCQVVSRIMQRPEIKARLAELQALVCKKIIKKEVRLRESRLKVYEELASRWQAVIEARSQDLVGIPGGESGLLVRDYKGKDADVPVYKVDAPSIQVGLNLYRQIAVEVGDWEEKQKVSGDVTIADTMRQKRFKRNKEDATSGSDNSGS